MPTFDPTLAATMAVFCELTYEQYAAGLLNPNYDGSVTGLTTPVPAGFVQTASFKAPEIDISNSSPLLRTIRAGAVDLTDLATLRSLTLGLQDVFFGFAGTWNGNGIVAMRGTRSPEEWIADLTAVQVDVPLVWLQDGKFQIAKADLGFLALYAFLFDQVNSALDGFGSSQPVIATGHSLGHALAVFSAATSAVGHLKSTQLYSFAGPRVGDPIFTDAYNSFVPGSFRVVNLSDVVPVLPPTSIFGYQYNHVGQEWSYLFQTGDVGTNHSLTDNYLPAVTPPAGPVETDATRTYPTSGLP